MSVFLSYVFGTLNIPASDNLKAPPLGKPFFRGKCWHRFRPEDTLAPFPGGVGDLGPIFLF